MPDMVPGAALGASALLAAVEVLVSDDVLHNGLHMLVYVPFPTCISPPYRCRWSAVRSARRQWCTVPAGWMDKRRSACILGV